MKDFFRFIGNPRKYVQDKNRAKKSGVKLFFATLLLSLLLIYITNVIFNLFSIQKDTVPQLEDNLLSQSALLMTLIIAPFHEEFLFRLPLRLNIKNITIGTSLLIGTIFSLIATQYLGLYSYQGIPLFQINSFILSIVIFFIIRGALAKKKKLVLRFLYHRYNQLFLFLILLFCCSHYLNYQNLDIPYAVYLLIVYLIYGYALSYIRINQGIKASVILHFAFLAPLIIQTLLTIQ